MGSLAPETGLFQRDAERRVGKRVLTRKQRIRRDAQPTVVVDEDDRAVGQERDEREPVDAPPVDVIARDDGERAQVDIERAHELGPARVAELGRDRVLRIRELQRIPAAQQSRQRRRVTGSGLGEQVLRLLASLLEVGTRNGDGH